ARIELGDIGGTAEAERGLALAREIRSVWVSGFGGNLAVSLFDLGRLDRAFELLAEAHDDATRLGNAPNIEWLDVLRMREHYWKGNWEDALRIADEKIASEGQDAQVRPRTVRSQIHLARGRV